ncbi:SUMF1/EgtB/PvdO family nonheme iron enzyme [Desulfobacterales bacterium HSG2]|nr:SUMF1/EgtB/PvdO family nonheme iron enzyme [Desulfobacterales bacterium HSG2]
MKKVAMCMVVLFCFSFLAAALAWNDGRGIKRIKKIADLSHDSGKLGRYHALVIGIDKYQDDLIRNLKTARNDAVAVAGLLRERYGFRTELLLDGQATKEAVFNALRRLAAESEEHDSLLIYYAGHGEPDPVYNDGWWIPTDAEAGKPLTYLRNTEVQMAMKSMNARHVLLISDSCYSGTLFGQTRGMPTVIGERYYLSLHNKKSRWGMTSGSMEPVSDLGSGGHSIFAYQLLSALEENEKAYISTQEIFTQIAPVVGNNSTQTPECRPILHTGDLGGQFVFVRSKGIRVATGGATVTRPSAKGTLDVECSVSGARVLVDGGYVGTTDLSGVAVTPGEHRILVEKEGYETYQRRISIEAGRSMSLFVELTPVKKKMRLYVDTHPADAGIRILNIRPRFRQGIELDPGEYHLEISADGYETEKRWITTEAGRDRSLSIRLNAVIVASRPAESGFANSIGMKFVHISAGTFMMGSPSDEPERDDDERLHRVTLTKGFYMQTTEVTQGQWKAVMGSNPSRFKNCGNNCPVEKVSWDDVQEFIKKLNRKEGTGKYRLPTEAEWEYACRAGTKTALYTGNIRILGDNNAPALDSMVRGKQLCKLLRRP